jgi:hypothetical protein
VLRAAWTLAADTMATFDRAIIYLTHPTLCRRLGA